MVCSRSSTVRATNSVPSATNTVGSGQNVIGGAASCGLAPACRPTIVDLALRLAALGVLLR